MGFLQRCLTRIPSILLLGALYVVYVLIGGVVFWKLEGGVVQQDIVRILQAKSDLLTTFPCLNQEGLEELAEVREKDIRVRVRNSIERVSRLLSKWVVSE